MTAGLSDSCTGSSYLGTDSLASGRKKVRKKNKKFKEGGTIMLVKKHLVPQHSSAYRNSTSTIQQLPAPTTKKPNAAIVIPKSIKVSIKKKIKGPKLTRPPNTELLLTQTKQIVGDNENLHLLQKAILDFKSQRDQFVYSLEELQKKLKEFQVPELFAQSDSKMNQNGKYHQRSDQKYKREREKRKNEKIHDKTDNADDKGDGKGKIRKKKDVRSVSQHFYLADMTESEHSCTTSSSSTESDSTQDDDETDAMKQTVKSTDSLNTYLIPIQPPEKRQNMDCVNSLLKHKSPWVTMISKSSHDGKLETLKRSVMEVGIKKVLEKDVAS